MSDRVLVLFFGLCFSFSALGSETKSEVDKEGSKKNSIESISKKSEIFEGFFTLLREQEKGSLYLKIRPDQIGEEFIHTVVAQNGVVAGGHYRGQYRDNKILSLRRHFNKIEFVQANTKYYFDPDSPLARASGANIPSAILAVEKIIDEDDETGEILISLDTVLKKEKLSQIKPTGNPRAKPGDRFVLGKLNDKRSKILAVKSYPKNSTFLTELVYENSAPFVRGDEDVTDPRAVSVMIQHTFIKMPEEDFTPRKADYRMGYFTDRITDLTSRSVVPYRDVINRWHLRKKDPTAKLSDPVQPIVWWIENTTPYEYRDLIKEAGLLWNKSFEKAGFTNAIEIRVQPDDAEWDAGDLRYNVLRWTSSPNPPFGGYGPSFTNPRTGQIVGADIMLEFAFLTNRLRTKEALKPSSPENPMSPDFCNLGFSMQSDYLFASGVLEALPGRSSAMGDLTRDSIFMLVLHELGHTLGLTHNMRASQLHSRPFDAELVSERGLSASVMDYEAVNVAPSGATQTFFYQNRPGPYDDWVIEYGYSESLADETLEGARLERILSRSVEPALAYGNDADDMRRPGRGIDPEINIYDLSSDALGYAEKRLELVKEAGSALLKDYSEESYQKAYDNFSVLVNQLARSGGVVSRYIGGVHINRHAPGSSEETPYQPVEENAQKRAMQILAKYIFAPDVLDSLVDNISYLQRQRRGFDFYQETEDPKVHKAFLQVHSRVLDHLLHPTTLKRILDSGLYGNDYSLLKMMGDLSDAIFLADENLNVNSIRQNLQIDYVKRLISTWSGPASKNHGHITRTAIFSQLNSIKSRVGYHPRLNSETKAHREHLRFLVDQALAMDV